MRILNRTGVSHAWVRAIEKMFAEPRNVPGYMSCTEAINPPRIRQLMRRHWHDDRMTMDVVDGLWALLGTAVHNMLETDDDDAITEQRFVLNRKGVEISMQPDRSEEIEGTTYFRLVDFKTSSIWTAIFGIKDEWIAQGNIYAYGLEQVLGHRINSIAIELLMKDWRRGEMKKERALGKDYPEDPLRVIPVPRWSDDDVEAYLDERIALHKAADNMSDEELPPCTRQERWAKPDAFAVKKIQKNGKPAARAIPGSAKLATLEEAQAFAATKDYVCHIEHRKAESVRCEHYCSAKPFCNQYRWTINPLF